MADHGQRCIVPGCAGDVATFHCIPIEKNCQRAWLKFIFNRIPRDFNSRWLVCSAHFTPDSFSNLGQFQAGFAQRLTLNRGAVPNVLLSQSQPQPSTSHQLPRAHHVGCQTEPPSVTLVSRGTQLSSKTLRPHLRSKGIQATVSSESVALGTTTQPFTSTPLKDSQPAKRPRLELKEEVEDVAIVGTDPQDATYDAAQSVPTETESSQLFASSAFSRGVLCAPVLVIFGLAEEGPS